MWYSVLQGGSLRVSHFSQRLIPRVVVCLAAWMVWLLPLAASAADFAVAPTDLAFGSVPLGASASMAVTITNTSGVSQTPNFSGGAPNDPVNFGGFQNCAGVPLPPGGSCQFTYEFHPTTLGAKSSSTTIGINSENFSITMSGTGISPFSVTPTNLNFGSVPLGASASLVVTITNTSGVSQTPNFSGGAPNDPVNFGGFQNCAGVPLAPGGSCQFTYEFHPTTLGAKSSSTTIGINSENFSITMSGTGISAFSVTPTNLNFGSVPLGASASLAVTITNTSGVSQTPNFAGGAPNDPVNFGGFQNCAGVPLPPGGSCQFTYEFHPTTLGAKSSSTTIGINSENFSITMSGTGGAFNVAPLDVAFGNVPLFASASMAVTITNVSGLSQTPTFTGGAPLDATNFGFSQNCAGVTLPPGGTCTFMYTFHPVTAGPISSSTTIGIDGNDTPITLSGVGVAVQPVPMLDSGSLGALAATLALIGLLVLNRRS